MQVASCGGLVRIALRVTIGARQWAWLQHCFCPAFYSIVDFS